MAAFIKEEVAFVIDWADSRIRSSKVIFSRDTYSKEGDIEDSKIFIRCASIS